MANATITPQTSGTQAGNFTVNVTFGVPVIDFDESKITITAISGNGITSVTFEAMGDGATYNIIFQLPEDVEGSLSIDITGMVTPEGSSSPENVTANSVVVVYDNITQVTATFGTVEYRDGGVIRVPVIFQENVIAPAKSVFEVRHVLGDDLAGVNYRLVGKGTDFELVFEIPPDRKGSFRIQANGDVFKRSSGMWDNVLAQPVTVAYDTRVPEIVDFDVPGEYSAGANFDVRVAYNVRVTGLSDNNVQQVFLLEGAANVMGTPTPYKWVGASAPDFNTAVPDDLTGTDWQQLSSPPAGVPITPENDFDENGFWHGAANEGQYFLIRWQVQENTTGIFSMTPRGILRGPIGS